MVIAYYGNKIIPPTKNIDAYCLECNQLVIACIGEIVEPYWRHYVETNCKGSDGETEWHFEMKTMFNTDEKDYTEVTVNGKIADIKLDNGLVIECQHSPISTHEVMTREVRYRNMMWIFDCRIAYNKDNLYFRQKENLFKWITPWITIQKCTKQVFLDIGIGFIKVEKIIHTDKKNKYGFVSVFYIYGSTVSKQDLILFILNEDLKLAVHSSNGNTQLNLF